jgi:hypothetical protein
MKRGCTCEDVCNVVAFLASDQADHVTDQAVNGSGGQEMRSCGGDLGITVQAVAGRGALSSPAGSFAGRQAVGAACIVVRTLKTWLRRRGLTIRPVCGIMVRW